MAEYSIKKEELDLLNYSTDVMTGGVEERMQLYYQLANSLSKANSVDIIVSFLMESGVKLLLKDLENTLKEGLAFGFLPEII